MTTTQEIRDAVQVLILNPGGSDWAQLHGRKIVREHENLSKAAGDLAKVQHGVGMATDEHLLRVVEKLVEEHLENSE